MSSSSSSDGHPQHASGVCRVCGAAEIVELLDVGPQPLCNRFLTSAVGHEDTYPMVLAQCPACRVVQLATPVRPADLVPPYGWIKQNEPEGHLDQAVETIARLPGISPDAAILGVTYKDASTLERLRRREYRRAVQLDPAGDLGIGDARAGLETVQDRFGPEAAARIVDRYGTADVVIARHVLEHAHNPRRFLEGLRALLTPDGYAVLEMPDSKRALETLDYSMLWEEHVLYPTPVTARHCLGAAGWSVLRFDVYPYPYEDSLVAVARPARASATATVSQTALEAEIGDARRFAAGFETRRHALRRVLSEHRRRHGRIAMFGAGHRACTFLNVMELGDLVDVTVDDDPHKAGLLMPGSHVPIVGSAVLLAEDIGLCLMSLSPESEEKVIRRHEAFAARGGRFASIFPASRHALRLTDEGTWSA